MVIHNFWAVDETGYYTRCWSWRKTDGRGLSMDENWPAGDSMVINPDMSVGRIPPHDITTAISVASRTFKNAYFWKCVIVYWKATRKKNYEFVSKDKIELHLFQQYFTPHTPPLKQGQTETTLGPDLLSTRIIRSTIPFRKCFKSCSPMSDLVTHYGPQATTRFTCLVLVPLEQETSKSECRKKRREN
jgi:hypothetical protein